ncbi:hypothetical protein GC089_01655 [Cellulomonas sp. JZ18]|uniref:hypothetical protein n=1 Tax=Cellulomonas sp. JZ18 TaxID=2654191 RepID=UPI0012D3900A|nr:hypothetical protein [Cellulomonas sp. JZ18]QGQ18210.1 hypothetical protein GC089_01655 [Cellulomonas sp. JZ18]
MTVPTTPDEHDDATTGTTPDPVRGTAPTAEPAPDDVEVDRDDPTQQRGLVPPAPGSSLSGTPVAPPPPRAQPL